MYHGGEDRVLLRALLHGRQHPLDLQPVREGRRGLCAGGDGVDEVAGLVHEGVLVPEAVANELSAAGAPGIVREWITTPPAWVDVRPVTSEALSRITDDLTLVSERQSRSPKQRTLICF